MNEKKVVKQRGSPKTKKVLTVPVKRKYVKKNTAPPILPIDSAHIPLDINLLVEMVQSGIRRCSVSRTDDGFIEVAVVV